MLTNAAASQLTDEAIINQLKLFFDSCSETSDQQSKKTTEILFVITQLDTLLSKKSSSKDKAEIIKNIFENDVSFKQIIESLFREVTINRAGKQKDNEKTVSATEMETFYNLFISLKKNCASCIGLFAKTNLESLLKLFKEKLSKTALFNKNPSINNVKLSSNKPKNQSEIKASFDVKLTLDEILNKALELKKSGWKLNLEDTFILLQKLKNAHDTFTNRDYADWELIRKNLDKGSSNILQTLLQEISNDVVPKVTLENLANICYFLTDSYILHEKLYLSIEERFKFLVNKQKMLYCNEFPSLGEKCIITPPEKTVVDLVHFTDFFSTFKCLNEEVIRTCCDALENATRKLTNQFENNREMPELEYINKSYENLIYNLFILIQSLPNTKENTKFLNHFSEQMSNEIIKFKKLNEKSPDFPITRNTWAHWLCFAKNHISEEQLLKLNNVCPKQWNTNIQKRIPNRNATGFERDVETTLKQILKLPKSNNKTKKTQLDNEYMLMPFSYDLFLCDSQSKYNYTIEANGKAYHYLLLIESNGLVKFDCLDGKSTFKKNWAMKAKTICSISGLEKSTIAIDIHQDQFYSHQDRKARMEFMISFFKGSIFEKRYMRGKPKKLPNVVMSLVNEPQKNATIENSVGNAVEPQVKASIAKPLESTTDTNLTSLLSSNTLPTTEKTQTLTHQFNQFVSKCENELDNVKNNLQKFNNSQQIVQNELKHKSEINVSQMNQPQMQAPQMSTSPMNVGMPKFSPIQGSNQPILMPMLPQGFAYQSMMVPNGVINLNGINMQNFKVVTIIVKKPIIFQGPNYTQNNICYQNSNYTQNGVYNQNNACTTNSLNIQNINYTPNNYYVHNGIYNQNINANGINRSPSFVENTPTNRF